MHAVGNRLLADMPAAKVLYIHAEQFVSDVVKAYQRKTFDEFKERYHSLDLLLIDDARRGLADVLAGSTRTADTALAGLQAGRAAKAATTSKAKSKYRG